MKTVNAIYILLSTLFHTALLQCFSLRRRNGVRMTANIEWMLIMDYLLGSLWKRNCIGTGVVPTFQKRKWTLEATEEAAKGTDSVVEVELLGLHSNYWSHHLEAIFVKAFETRYKCDCSSLPGTPLVPPPATAQCWPCR